MDVVAEGVETPTSLALLRQAEAIRARLPVRR
jgi:EAL domain-containing protein (putative c-di-GMP-specific phosphodiesterase class I)